MKKRYQILWIDDEPEKQEAFLESAYLEGLDINYYKTSKSGIEELSLNVENYDGVILDAMGYNKSEDEKANLTGLYNSIKQINMLSHRKKIPYFVFSAYIDHNDHASARELLSEEKIFIKSRDNMALFKAIKKEADKQKDTQLRHQYQRVFAVCNEKYIGEKASIDILKLMLGKEDHNTDAYFNTLRKIIEDIFVTFNKFNLLPNEFVIPVVAINESCKFLSGKDHKGNLFTVKGYQHLEETHLPEQISKMIWGILSTTQDGSHRLLVDSHAKLVNTSYLFQSTLYQLLDVIIWFKIHVDSNPKTENWKKNDKAIVEVDSNIKEGIVINFNSFKGYAFLKPIDGTENVYIPAHLVSSNSLRDDIQIQAEIEEYTDNRTQELKKRVKRIILK